MELDFEAVFNEKKEPDPATPAEVELVESTPFDSNQLDNLLSFDRAKGSFVELQTKLELMTKKAQLIKVEDADSNKIANEMLIQCRQVQKAVEKIKSTMPEYASAAKFKNSMDRHIRTLFTENLTRISNKILAPKISQYQKAEAELVRRKVAKLAEKEAEERRKQLKIEVDKKAKADALALKEHEERQAKLNLEAKEAGVESVKLDAPILTTAISSPEIITIPPVLETPEKRVETDSGSSTIKAEWIYKIVDPQKVPREYCSPDDKKLKAAVKAGIRTIAGCEISEDFKAAVRVKSK